MKVKEYLRKPIVRKFVFIFAAIFYIFCIIGLCSHIDVDSDRANHLLQAEDILSGNFFMSDWVLTGITFFTTDLIYYEIGKIFCGVTPEAIYVTGGLMVSSALIAGFLQVWQEKRKILS